jgi:homoserine dehydrogenase
MHTIHLIGPGHVGREFLALLTQSQLQAHLQMRLLAVSDRLGVLCDERGLDPAAVALVKAAGRPLCDLGAVDAGAAEFAVARIRADVVVDATDSTKTGTDAAIARGHAALQIGAYLALSGKNALAAAAPAWLLGVHRGRVGVNAVLGGAGAQLVDELDELRAGCERVMLNGNVTTGVIVQAIERGASVEQGIAHAASLGLLETDPTLDFDGSDAAVKLLAVAGAVFGDALRPAPSFASVQREDVRTLDAKLLRDRVRRGATTRLIARADRAGLNSVRFEEIVSSSPLLVPADCVAYGYEIAGQLRVHLGHGVGYRCTAAALMSDVIAFVLR